MSPSTPPRLPHRPLLDGFRGLLIGVTVAFHLGGWTAPPGGWVGVSGFFVLSGFLITAVLLAERAREGRISLRRFFAGRARRLIPALLVVTAATLAVGIALGGAEVWPTLGGDGLATLLYASNWRFIVTDQSYVASFNPSPLRHMWSLSIEEQFYLAWPLLVTATVAVLGRRRAPWAWLVAAGASALWMARLVATGADVSRAYYGTDTRAQELLVGAALAAVLLRPDGSLALPPGPERPGAEGTGSGRDRPGGDRRARWGVVTGTLGLAGMALVAVGLPTEAPTTYTRLGMLAAAVASALVVHGCVTAERGWWARLFRSRAMIALGRRSYVLYLVHWPVIVFMAPPRLHWSPVVLDAARVAISLVLTEGVHRLVEKPIHRRTVRLPRPGLLLGAATVAVAALAGAALTIGSDTGTTPLAVEAGVVTAPATTAPAAGTPTSAGAAEPLQVVVLGDSQAYVLLNEAPDDPGIVVRGAHHARCDINGEEIYVGEGVDRATDDCPAWPVTWGLALGDGPPPDAVVVALGLRQLFDMRVDGHRLEVGTAEWEEEFRDDLVHAVRTIRHETQAPIVWLDVPCYRWGEATEVTDGDRIAAVNAVIADLMGRTEGVTVAPYAERVCTGEDGSRPRDDLRPDGAHLTVPEAARTWAWLRDVIDDVR